MVGLKGFSFDRVPVSIYNRIILYHLAGAWMARGTTVGRRKTSTHQELVWRWAATGATPEAGRGQVVRRPAPRDHPPDRRGRPNTVDLWCELLERFRGLAGIAGAGIHELRGIKGIGPAKAAEIKAAKYSMI